MNRKRLILLAIIFCLIPLFVLSTGFTNEYRFDDPNRPAVPEDYIILYYYGFDGKSENYTHLVIKYRMCNGSFFSSHRDDISLMFDALNYKLIKEGFPVNLDGQHAETYLGVSSGESETYGSTVQINIPNDGHISEGLVQRILSILSEVKANLGKNYAETRICLDCGSRYIYYRFYDGGEANGVDGGTGCPNCNSTNYECL